MFGNMDRKTGLFFIPFILIIILACNMPGQPEPTIIPVTGASPVAVTAAPTYVEHSLIPADLPAERSNHAGDYDASESAHKQEAAGGDRFTFGQFERPFNAHTMDVYFPQLDILDTVTYQDDTWIYVSLKLKGRDPDDRLSGNYGLELDMDVDGNGDWLVLVSNPSSQEWTVDGVTIWQDTNKDVGGEAAAYTDEHPYPGNGFDRLAFGTGEDLDPDMAWARISPVDPNVVQLAVKRSLFDHDDSYLAGTWAGNASLDPARFDFNDHMTHEQAGAATRGYEYFYPIKELAELDSSCRMAIGFQPTGNEPGLCKSLIPAVPNAPGCPNTCDPGWVQSPYPDCTCTYYLY
jgi:hypothetical protein